MGINSININIYWVLTGYPIWLNYDSSIIFTNHLTSRYPKSLKIIKILSKPENDQNILKNLNK